MITLHQPPQVFDLINISPFCLKLETFLRMAELEYQAVAINTKTFMRAPNRKVPWVEVDGQNLPDSSLIINYLKETRDIDLMAGYSSDDKALAMMTQRMLEEHLYWGIGYFRWVEDAGWPAQVLKVFNPKIPFRGIIGQFVKRGFVAQLKAHGLGLHTGDIIFKKCCDDIDALSKALGDKPYYMGESASEIDCTVFAFVDSLINEPSSSRLKAVARSYTNLSDYAERMGRRYFPEVYG